MRSMLDLPQERWLHSVRIVGVDVKHLVPPYADTVDAILANIAVFDLPSEFVQTRPSPGLMLPAR
jgi:hypothetical protein